MKINFTKEQYLVLIKMLEIADHVLDVVDDEGNDKRAIDILNHVYRHADAFGAGDLFEYDDEDETYYPTAEFDEMLGQIVTMIQYDETVFWDPLINRLAIRDLKKKGISLEIDQEEPFEYLADLAEERIKYEEEFEKNGIENLIITHPITNRFQMH